jgi:hypothetical protein
MKQYDETKEPAGMIPVQRLKGQFVKRKTDAHKVYKVGAYDKASRRWELCDCEDWGRCIYVKPGTLLYAGFEY